MLQRMKPLRCRTFQHSKFRFLQENSAEKRIELNLAVMRVILKILRDLKLLGPPPTRERGNRFIFTRAHSILQIYV